MKLLLRKIWLQINYKKDYPVSLYPVTGLLNKNSGITTLFPPIKEVLHMAGYGLDIYVIRSNTTNNKCMKNTSKLSSLVYSSKSG